MSPLELTRLYFTLSNSGNLDDIEKMLHEDAIYSSENVGLFFGKSAIMKMMRDFFERFEYLHWDILSLQEISEGIIEAEYQALFRNQDDTTVRTGTEKIIIKEGSIRYIEVKNH